MKLSSTMVGSRAKPYTLHLPAAIYKKEGSNLGFTFSSEEISQACETNRCLGIQRYLPKGESYVKLSIPPGSYVKCFVSEHVI